LFDYNTTNWFDSQTYLGSIREFNEFMGIVIENAHETIIPKELWDKVKEVVLYNDRIEIYYNYIDKEPDGENSHQAFSFYECRKSYIIDKRKIGGSAETLIFEIKLYI
jgi:small nuclear ribonucleoprotein (snRNP)-like protein